MKTNEERKITKKEKEGGEKEKSPKPCVNLHWRLLHNRWSNSTKEKNCGTQYFNERKGQI